MPDLTDEYLAERRKVCEWFTERCDADEILDQSIVQRSRLELAYLDEIARLRADFKNAWGEVVARGKENERLRETLRAVTFVPTTESIMVARKMAADVLGGMPSDGLPKETDHAD